jgi:hypothetical protein
MAQLQIRRKTDLDPLRGLVEGLPAGLGNAVQDMFLQVIDRHEGFLKKYQVMTAGAILSITESIGSIPSSFSLFGKGGQGDFEIDFLDDRQEKRLRWAIWQNFHAISTSKWIQWQTLRDTGEADKSLRSTPAGGSPFQESFGVQQRKGVHQMPLQPGLFDPHTESDGQDL